MRHAQFAAWLSQAFDARERPQQHDFAQCVAALFDAEDPAAGQPARLVAIQADTGTGKTRAYMAAAALAASAAGERVVIGTHSHALIRQIVEREAQAVRDLLDRKGLPCRFSVGVRLGRRNFVSLQRARELAPRHAELAAWLDYLDDPDASGTFLEAAEAWGLRLPAGLTPEHLCVTAGERSAHFERHRMQALDADVLVTTHAMLLADARRWGRVLTAPSARRIAIIDEADALVHAAEQDGIVRVGHASLLALAQRVGGITRVRSALAELRALATDRVVGSTHPSLTVVDDLCAWLRGLDVEGDDADERDRLLGDLGEWVDNVDARDAASLVESAALASACVDAGRVVSRLWAAGKERPPYLRGVALVSATLGAGDGDDFTDMLRRVGVFSAHAANYDARASRAISMGAFGNMRFVLADRGVSVPFDGTATADDEELAAAPGRPLSPQWLSYAAAGIREASARGGRVLVLCASFDDVAALGALVPGALLHARGTKLARWVDAFLADPRAVLLTPAAWAGLDLPRAIAHVVIPRIPFAPADDAVDAAYRRVAEARGLNPATMKGALIQRNRADAARRLRQGMGRGVRVPDDAVTVWLLDPRFPLPPSVLRRGLRQRLTQGAAGPHAVLLHAVPLRFRAGQSSPLNGAEILSMEVAERGPAA